MTMSSNAHPAVQSGSGIDDHAAAPRDAPDTTGSTRRARVLVVAPQNSGGIWHYAFSLSKTLATAGFQTALATIFPFEDLGDSGGVQLYSMGTAIPAATPPPMRPVRRALAHLDKLHRLRRIVAEFRPDIVHLHDPIGKLDFLYLRVLKTRPAGIAYTAHDATPLQRRADWFDWGRYRAADAIIVHSAADAAVLAAGGIDGSRIAVIPHGNYLRYCPQPEPSSERAKTLLGVPARSRVVLFLGTIAPYKGLDVLIEAFAMLRTDAPDVYLVVAGQPLEDFAPYGRLIQDLNVSRQVILDLRYIAFSEFPTYFAAADLVALPYRRISQSGVLQLAYAYGRPVVVANVGGLGEAVAEDQTGVVVAGGDPKALCRAMRQVLGDKAAAAEMGARGSALAATKYSWDEIVKKVARVYRSISPASPAAK